MSKNKTKDTVTPEKAAEYLRLSLSKLGELKLPVTAHNYSLFYAYFSGWDVALNQRLDDILSTEKTISSEMVNELFEQFLCQCNSTDFETLNRELLNAVAQIIGSIIDFVGQSALSNQSLEKHLDKLSNTNKPAEILNAASEIIADTRQFVAKTQVFEESIRDSSSQIETLQEELILAREEATIDALTGLNNRRGLDKTLQESIDIANELKKPLCILLIDIDHFKKINDTHGHLIGDKVLKGIANQLSKQIRGDDYIARFGGEEFTVILKETPISSAFVVAEKIRSSVERLKLKEVKSGKELDPITTSLGVASYQYGENMEDLLSRCDEALYRAKQLGRNRTLIAE